jgi:signal transduction histidine kinase
MDRPPPKSRPINTDVFVRELAHELRTPIAQVQSIAELLLSGTASSNHAELARWLKLQIGVSKAMQITVNGLLDLSRNALDPSSIEWVDLHKVCADFSGDELLESRRSAIEWRIQHPLLVIGHAPQLVLLMRNLLSNAVKYTRDTDRPVIVVSSRVDSRGRLCIAVQDNGVGFDGRDAARLFRPFSRLNRREFKGVGIGLTLAKRVVECHGGWIRATGHRGLGARFEFSLGATASRRMALCDCARPGSG